MSENQNNTNETNEKSSDNSKKKKIIIIVSAAVILVAVVAAIVFALTRNNDSGYVDTPVVTEIVTDEQGEPVTDESGEVVTQIVTTTPAGNSDLGKNKGGNSGNGANTGNSLNSGNAGNNSAGTGNGTNSGNQNSGSGNQSGSGSGNQGSGSGNQGGNQGGNSNNPTNPNVPVGEKRKISITVTLPNGSGKNDTIEILVNGKVVDTHDVKLDYNSEYSFVTKDKYEGDAVVEARLAKYGTNASKTVLAGENSVNIIMPLNQVEEQEGIDD